MDKNPQDPAIGIEASRFLADGERLVYVMPADSMISEGDDGLDLAEISSTLWESRWPIIGITAIFTLAAVAYALLATPWYRAEVLLAPAAARTTEGLAGQLGGLSGLASLAGINIGGGGSPEPLAVLKSRNLARAFIEEQNLLPVLLAKHWDAKAGEWKSADPKDIRDAVRYFDLRVRRVQEDKKTGLVTLAVEWTDPKLAADWANLLAKRVNGSMRQRALAEAQANVSFLRNELAAANVVTLQQSIGRLLDSELQKLMLARGEEEFAFKVLDRADVPKLRARPKRMQVIVLGFFLGAMLSISAVFMRNSMRRRPRARAG